MVKMARYILPIRARFMMSQTVIYGMVAPTRDFMMQGKILLKKWTRHLMGLKYLRTILLSGL
jgi:hypothetical protein